MAVAESEWLPGGKVRQSCEVSAFAAQHYGFIRACTSKSTVLLIFSFAQSGRSRKRSLTFQKDALVRGSLSGRSPDVLEFVR